MNAAKRLKALNLIERVNRHKLETIGAELSALRVEQARLRMSRKELGEKAVFEAEQSTLETRKYLPAYLGSVDEQQRKWMQQQDDLEQEARDIELRLYAGFRDVKVQELVRNEVEETIALEDERAEMALQDDGARALFRMHKDN